jgi:hypothetical protein
MTRKGGTCYHERGFRGYGDDVTIRDCSAYHLVSNKGSWYLAGNVDPQGGNSRIDGYRSDHYLWIGPNSTCEWDTAGLANLTARNLDVADVVMELGSRNISIVNLSTVASQSLFIGSGSHCFPPNVPSCCCCPDEEEDPCYIGACYSSPLYRPLYNVHWANISGDFEIAENVPSICTDTSGESGTSPCLDYASVNAQSNLLCLGDIAGTPYCDPVTDPYCFPHWPGGDPDGTVNVDDLLGIINNWGACDGGSEPRYICRADIAPALGNGTVDVDDLLAVLNNWGDCRGGGIASAPDEVGDCFDYCESLSGQQWEDCMTRCLEAV